MINWQTIDTAPKTPGRFILLKGGETDEDFYAGNFQETSTRPVVAMWHDEFGEASWCVSFWDGAWRTTYENPTHWAEIE